MKTLEDLYSSPLYLYAFAFAVFRVFSKRKRSKCPYQTCMRYREGAQCPTLTLCSASTVQGSSLLFPRYLERAMHSSMPANRCSWGNHPSNKTCMYATSRMHQAIALIHGTSEGSCDISMDTPPHSSIHA